MKNILILGYTSLKRDPRIRRQIFALKEQYNITAVGTASPEIDGVVYKKIDFRNKPFERGIKLLLSYINLDLLYKFNIHRFAKFFKSLLESDPDLIIANDYQMLPFGVLLAEKKKCRVIFDAHEYYLDYDAVNSSFALKLHKKKVRYIFDKYLNRIDKMFTVSQGISDVYLEKHSIRSDIIDNAPAFTDISPSKVEGIIKLVHPGGALRKRNLDQLIGAVNILGDKYELHFYLVPSEPDYLTELKLLADSSPVYFHKPVTLEKLPVELNQYDIGVYSLPEKNINQKYAMPNKIFEFIQARLAVAISPTTAMKQFVTETQIGVVAEEFTALSLAKVIKRLDSADIWKYKTNADRISKVYNSEENAKKMRKIISSMMEKNND